MSANQVFVCFFHFETGKSAAIGAGDVRTSLLTEGATQNFPQIVGDFGNRTTRSNVMSIIPPYILPHGRIA